MPRIAFKYIYHQALSFKTGLEYDVDIDREFYRLDRITFATITPILVGRDTSKFEARYRVDAVISKDVPVTVELQQSIMRRVLDRAKRIVYPSNIRVIVFSANPDDIREFSLMFTFSVKKGEEPLPDVIVQAQVRACLSILSCITFPPQGHVGCEGSEPGEERDGNDWRYE